MEGYRVSNMHGLSLDTRESGLPRKEKGNRSKPCSMPALLPIHLPVTASEEAEDGPKCLGCHYVGDPHEF